MIDRYTLPKMGAIWSDKAKFSNWLAIEIAATEAQTELGNVPLKDLAIIKKKAKFNLKRINEIEAEVNHDVIAFLTSVAENVGPSSRFIHMGMTSSDVVDTGIALQLKKATEIIMSDLKDVIRVVRKRSLEHKDTLCIGRTHGIHAEPMTFGLKLAVWYFELNRSLERLEHALKMVSACKISGAVGTYSSIDPFVEEYVAKKLGLTPAEASLQVLQRDRHAELLSVLAILASSLEKFTTELRNLQRTDIAEVEEHFSKGQKGSSAMPHKKNPITSERVSGLARLMRGYALAELETVSLWHERDLTNSSVERVSLPDATILMDYMLVKFKSIIEDLKVNTGQMRENLDRTKGLIFSQKVLLALIEKGTTREKAYRIVQRNAHKAWQDKTELYGLLIKDTDVSNVIDKKELKKVFDHGDFLKNVHKVFERMN